MAKIPIMQKLTHIFQMFAKSIVFKLQKSYAQKNKPQLTMESNLACQTVLACSLLC